MADLDTLRPEVREAVSRHSLYMDCPSADVTERAVWNAIRAELVRLAVENATARGALETLDVEGHKRAEKAEAELAALRHENAQLRDVLADRDMDREMAAHANRELAALKARTRWQPIETAPKNGQTILAHKPSGLAFSARQDVVPVHWTGWGGGAWENSTSGHKVFDDLTHWMPLHEPPAEQGEE